MMISNRSKHASAVVPGNGPNTARGDHMADLLIQRTVQMYTHKMAGVAPATDGTAPTTADVQAAARHVLAKHASVGPAGYPKISDQGLKRVVKEMVQMYPTPPAVHHAAYPGTPRQTVPKPPSGPHSARGHGGGGCYSSANVPTSLPPVQGATPRGKVGKAAHAHQGHGHATPQTPRRQNAAPMDMLPSETKHEHVADDSPMSHADAYDDQYNNPGTATGGMTAGGNGGHAAPPTSHPPFAQHLSHHHGYHSHHVIANAPQNVPHEYTDKEMEMQQLMLAGSNPAVMMEASQAMSMSGRVTKPDEPVLGRWSDLSVLDSARAKKERLALEQKKKDKKMAERAALEQQMREVAQRKKAAKELEVQTELEAAQWALQNAAKGKSATTSGVGVFDHRPVPKTVKQQAQREALVEGVQHIERMKQAREQERQEMSLAVQQTQQEVAAEAERKREEKRLRIAMAQEEINMIAEEKKMKRDLAAAETRHREEMDAEAREEQRATQERFTKMREQRTIDKVRLASAMGHALHRESRRKSQADEMRAQKVQREWNERDDEKAADEAERRYKMTRANKSALEQQIQDKLDAAEAKRAEQERYGLMIEADAAQARAEQHAAKVARKERLQGEAQLLREQVEGKPRQIGADEMSMREATLNRQPLKEMQRLVPHPPPRR